MGSPKVFQEQGMQASGPVFWTTSLEMDPKSLQNRKTLGIHSFVKNLKCASQRREVLGTPGPKGQLSDAKSPPFQFL